MTGCLRASGIVVIYMFFFVGLVLFIDHLLLASSSLILFRLIVFHI